MGFQLQYLQAEQHYKHWNMDGAHYHVRLVEGGQDPGLHLTNREIPATFCRQLICDSDSFMAPVLPSVNCSEHLLPLLI